MVKKRDKVIFNWTVCDWKDPPHKGTSTVAVGYEGEILEGEDFDAAVDRISEQVLTKLMQLRKKTRRKAAQ